MVKTVSGHGSMSNGRITRSGVTEAVRCRLIKRAAEVGLDASDRDSVIGLLGKLVDQEAPLLSPTERKSLIDEVLAETVGLGPLEPLLKDYEVDEIMVNGPNSVYVERAGKIELTDVSFESNERLMHLIERILAPLGRRLDESRPL